MPAYSLVLLLVVVPANLLDELFHIAAAVCFGIPVDWHNTRLFGLKAFVGHYPIGPAKKAVFSIAAPVGWAVTGISTWTCILWFPESVENVGVRVFIWYLAVASVSAGIGNLLFAPPGDVGNATDLQQFLTALRQWRRQAARR